MIQKIGSVALWLCFLLWQMQPAWASSISLEVFAAPPVISDAALSPDGHFLAEVVLARGRQVVLVQELNGTKPNAHVVLADVPGKFDIRWCAWANKIRLLCGYRGVTVEDFVTVVITRLVAVDADGANQKVLLQDSTNAGGQFQDQVIAWNPGPADTVLVAADESLLDARALADLLAGANIYGHTSSDGYAAVFELNIRTGHTHLVLHSRPPIRDYLTDLHGVPRVAYGYENRTKTFQYFVRSDAHPAWQPLLKFDAFAPGDLRLPIALDSADPNRAFAIGTSNGRDALWSIDLSDQQAPQLVYANSDVDIDEPQFLKDGQLLGVPYETDRPHMFYANSRLQPVLRQLDAALPSTANSIVDCTQDQALCIVHAYSDVVPGTWYLLYTAVPKLVQFERDNPAIDSSELGRMVPISYPARDGTPIPGYLTVPPGQKTQNLPLIVMPHGGPIARDRWSYFFLQQFLVNRGYAVLQMNFRGSGGFGHAWYAAAHQDWGGLTYDDIVDGTRWAIQNGIADPKRIAIVGWSFGGYAALLGAARNSDLYRCAVSIAGVSDLGMLLTESYEFQNNAIVSEQVGTRTKKLRDDSPRRHTDAISIPVLLLHGDRDPQVEVEQSRAMAKALRGSGKSVEYIEFKGADHQISSFEDRKALLGAIERFLSANIGAPGNSSLKP